MGLLGWEGGRRTIVGDGVGSCHGVLFSQGGIVVCRCRGYVSEYPRGSVCFLPVDIDGKQSNNRNLSNKVVRLMGQAEWTREQ